MVLDIVIFCFVLAVEFVLFWIRYQPLPPFFNTVVTALGAPGCVVNPAIKKLSLFANIKSSGMWARRQGPHSFPRLRLRELRRTKSGKASAAT